MTGPEEFGPVLPVQMTREQAKALWKADGNRVRGAYLALMELGQRWAVRVWGGDRLSEADLDDVRAVIGGPDERFPKKEWRVELGDESEPPTELDVPLMPGDWEHSVGALFPPGTDPARISGAHVAALIGHGLPLTGHGPRAFEDRLQALRRLMERSERHGYREGWNACLAATLTSLPQHIPDEEPPGQTRPSSR